MKHYKNLLGGLTAILIMLVLIFFVFPAQAESKNATGTTETVIVFGPLSEGHQLTAVDATSDLAGSKVTVRSRTAATVSYKVNGDGATSQAVIPLSATTGLSSNDFVVVSGGSFAAYRGRIIATTSSNITLDANLTSAVASGDRVHELTTTYSIPVGSNSVNRTGSPLVRTPADSPIVLQLNSTSASELSATVK